MLTASVPVVISRTGSQSAARPLSVDGWASTPMTTPITAWASVVARRGTAAGARPASASAVATTRPAKSAGDGSRSSASAHGADGRADDEQRPPPPLARAHPSILAPPWLCGTSSDGARGLGARFYTPAMASPPEPSPPPERPVQLRNDLNDLYGLFGDLQTTVRGVAATQQDHGVRLVRVERGVTELRTDVTELRRELRSESPDRLRSDVTELRTDVTGLRNDVTELRTDVTEVRSDVTEVRSDVTELRTDVSGLRGGMAGVRGDLGGLRTDVDGLRAGQDEILRLLRDRA